MKCKICNSTSNFFSEAVILERYKIKYFQCSNCGFVQTEEPYWLEESYTESITKTDVGLVFRNNLFSQVTGFIISNFFNDQGNFLDYGGGCGLFVRLMRDLGYDFYWYDQYCKNLFARGFETQENSENDYDFITSFELFEHFANPLQEIENILKISSNILFSTRLLPSNNPKPNE